VGKLSLRDAGASATALLRLSARIALHRKLRVILLGIPAYYGVLYALAVFRPDEGFGVAQALHVLVEIPGIVLAIYLVMDQIAAERDRDTLELLYTVSASHYAVWLVRMLAIYGILTATVLSMSVLAYYLFAELPILWGGLNACLPALWMANLTLCLGAWCRSSNTAGMLAAGVALAALVTSASLAGSVFALFLNPFDPPVGADVYAWGDTVWINRLSIAGLSALLLLVALRMMANRERLLA